MNRSRRQLRKERRRKREEEAQRVSRTDSDSKVAPGHPDTSDLEETIEQIADEIFGPGRPVGTGVGFE